MKKYVIISILFVSFINLFAQEALKSNEEEYYDFLSLKGLVERPVLGYRTLSDSVWIFNEITTLEENEEGSFTKVRIPGEESTAHLWKNNKLGTTYTLWQPDTHSENWFARGLKQGLSARIYGPEWFNSYNTTTPYGQNDGALWQGRGYNTALTTGIRLEGFGFELTFKPHICWSQNKDFEINKEIFPNQYSFTFQNGTVHHPIDYVQRYGDKSFWNYDWGDTEVRWSWYSLTFGFGRQNPWLGPAYLNPMLGSNNAPGYLKFDAGLRKTEIILPFVNWSLGFIEGRIWVGQLENSDYFTAAIKNEKRMLIGMSASYAPSFIPGLTIGLNRIFMTYWRPENIQYILRLFTASRSNGYSSGNDEDQKFSLFAEWNFPKVGFTVYGEFGRDDFSLVENTNPFHTAIYTVGAKQIIPLPANLSSELNFEWNNFEMSQDFQLQWPYLGYYAHGFVNQGYTNKGQILGAGSGFAGNSQFIQYKVYYPKGYTALKFHRYCPNNNSVLSQAVNTSTDAENGPIFSKWYCNFESYFCIGIEDCFYFTKDFYSTLNITLVNIYNSHYRKETTTNVYCNLTAKYVF